MRVAILKEEPVVRLSVSVVPPAPAVPNTSESPEMGGNVTVPPQLPAVPQLPLVPPVQVTVPVVLA